MKIGAHEFYLVHPRDFPLIPRFPTKYSARRTRVLSRQARHSHLPLKKIVPDSLELWGGRSKDENTSSRSTVWAATAAVYRLGMIVIHAAIRVYGDLQSKLRRSLSYSETCLSDTGQSQRFFGDEKHAVSRYSRKY